MAMRQCGHRFAVMQFLSRCQAEMIKMIDIEESSEGNSESYSKRHRETAPIWRCDNVIIVFVVMQLLSQCQTEMVKMI